MMQRILITDPSIFTSSPRHFAHYLTRVLRHHRPDAVMLRDKRTKHLSHLAHKAYQITKQFGIPLRINGDLALAQSLRCGVHLTSTQHHLIQKAKRSGCFVSVSTHQTSEALLCAKQGADEVFFSPIFYVKHKGEPKGIEALAALSRKIPNRIIGLGGIVSLEHVSVIEKSGARGFASIRYFNMNH